MVIVKKKPDAVFDKKIAAIFKTWNIFEYKGPDDSLSAADFHKAMAYAHLYCTPPERGAMDDLTLSFVISRDPRELKAYLREVCHYTLTEKWPGIILLTGGMMAMQIIVRTKLPAGEFRWLAGLGRGLSRESAKGIIAEAEKVPKEAPIRAYMYMVVQSNDRMVEELGMTGDARIEQICIERGIAAKWEAKYAAKWEAKYTAKGEAKGEARGEAKGTRKVAKKLKKMGDPDKKIAKVTGLSLEEIAKL
jgi:hypothetical protein